MPKQLALRGQEQRGVEVVRIQEPEDGLQVETLEPGF